MKKILVKLTLGFKNAFFDFFFVHNYKKCHVCNKHNFKIT